MGEPGENPILYGELASWFHLLTAPSDYEIGARQAMAVLSEAIGDPPATILELGSGGGNNASHMKRHASLTLTDRSPAMLELSHALNPECEHIEGDMTSLRLDRTFDAVFVHDAVSYLTTEDQLRAAIETAWEHCRPGGAVLLQPDHTRESYEDGTDHGGHDGGSDGLPDDGRSLRYLQWRWDPDPTDSWYFDDFAYLLRDRDGSVRTFADRHRLGMFPAATWFSLLGSTGFVDVTTVASGYEEAVGAEGFLACRPR